MGPLWEVAGASRARDWAEMGWAGRGMAGRVKRDLGFKMGSLMGRREGLGLRVGVDE